MLKEKRKRNGIWFWLGMALMALTMAPNLLLGENAVFTYHDQLDGDLLSYILQARHLFSGDILPEFMGGASKAALTMPAPACVLLFLGGNSLAALTVMQLAGRLIGFAGMYLLVRETGGKAWIGTAVGIFYGLLPFLPVYGLSQYGIPLLFWCGLQLRKERHLVLSYCCVALFGAASSLVLVGYGLLGMGAVIFIGDLCRKRRPWHFLAAWQLLLVIYAAGNFRLLGQIMGLGGTAVSHKAEYVLAGEGFWNGLWQGFFYGGQHSEGYQELFAPVMAVIAAGILVIQAAKGSFGGKEKKYLKEAGLCLGWNLVFAVLAALWNSEALTGLRGAMGALGAFQLDRVLWIAPCLWYLALGCVVSAVWELWSSRRGGRRLAAGGGLGVLAAVMGVTGFRILMEGDIKSNIQKLRNPDYGILSYGDYYALGVMEQVRDFLTEQTGMKQEEYRVVSLGIDPAAALYHGFYCLDGYSNNYSLAYKHAFREIIRPELEKSEYLKAYFDDWGNRCYLYSAEVPGYYTIEKHGFFFRDYELDTAALRDMGCAWLLSAAYIQNAREQGLELMNETPFETEGSYYGIYVYEVKGK